jgi:hypothetical protein
MRPLHQNVTFDEALFSRFDEALLHTKSNYLSYRVWTVFATQNELFCLQWNDGSPVSNDWPAVGLFRWRQPHHYSNYNHHWPNVFDYDYAAMRDAMRPLREELLRVVLHPRRALCVLYDDAAAP